MKKSIFSKYALTAFAIGVIVTSCKKDDDNPSPTPNPEPEQVVTPRLAIVASDVNATPGQNAPNGAPSVNNGTTHLLIIDDATKAQTDFDVIGNPNAVKTYDALFQIHYNEATKTIGGYVYGRAAAQAPDGLGGAGARFYNVEGTKLTHLNNLQSGFGLAGVAGKYSYMAESNDVITVFQRNGNQVIKTDTNLNLEKDGIYASGWGYADLGNGKIAVALKYGGNNENVSVAIANYDMSGAKLITDNRIGESGANVRSNKYSQIATTDSGDVYVFSGTGGLITSEKREVRGRDGKVRTQTVHTSDGSKAGVVRIKKGVETFDMGYHFNIYEKSGGYQFQKVFYIGGDKFLVEFFAEKGKFTMNDEAGKFALVDVNAKTINWLTNLPTLYDSQFPVGYGSSYNKVLYLPITKSDGSCSVYTINEKGEVKEHIKLKAGQTSRAVSIIVD